MISNETPILTDSLDFGFKSCKSILERKINIKSRIQTISPETSY